MRLKTRSDFVKVAKQGKRLVGKLLCLDFLPSKRTRVGISASTKYGSAPERNRFKRLIREVARKEALALGDLHAIPRQGAKTAKYADIRNEIHRLLADAVK